MTLTKCYLLTALLGAFSAVSFAWLALPFLAVPGPPPKPHAPAVPTITRDFVRDFVRDCGGVGDGKTDNTAAFARCYEPDPLRPWDRLDVNIPGGVYFLGGQLGAEIGFGREIRARDK